MVCSVEQLLADAKNLVERLRSHDSTADKVISQANNLKLQMQSMKDYQEEVERLNKVACHRPRSALIYHIQQENRYVRELSRENRELQAALEEHQCALELIMSKYREQRQKFVLLTRIEKAAESPEVYGHSQDIVLLTDKITEMAAVMRQAASMEELDEVKYVEEIAKLQLENKTMREMLASSNLDALTPITEDKEIQASEND